jgi:uncharacterized protein DUF1996
MQIFGRAFASALLLILAASCKSDVQPNADVPVTVPPTPAPPAQAPLPSPTPPPPPAGTIPIGEAPIASEFDYRSQLVSKIVPPSNAPDVVGAFRFICLPGHLAYDDPIVFPGQPGRSHLHQFYGNTGTNANSTYRSLRTSGNSTCMSPVNRSAYWMPAMLDGRGNVVRPDYVTIYYKRRPASDPKCNPARDPAAEGICVPLPNGLKFVFGYNMLNPSTAPTGALYFNCDGAGATLGHYPDIVAASRFCPSGSRLGALISAPNCWDGRNLDSPDHRSHVSYMVRDRMTGVVACPATHPYVIPTFTMGAWYMTDSTLDRSGSWTAGRTVTWHLASDVMAGMPMARPGTTFHADFMMAWDPAVKDLWHANCIDRMLSCAAGLLGNGQQINQTWPFSWTANPRRVPVPAP